MTKFILFITVISLRTEITDCVFITLPKVRSNDVIVHPLTKHYIEDNSSSIRLAPRANIASPPGIKPPAGLTKEKLVKLITSKSKRLKKIDGNTLKNKPSVVRIIKENVPQKTFNLLSLVSENEPFKMPNTLISSEKFVEDTNSYESEEKIDEKTIESSSEDETMVALMDSYGIGPNNENPLDAGDEREDEQDEEDEYDEEDEEDEQTEQNEQVESVQYGDVSKVKNVPSGYQRKSTEAMKNKDMKQLKGKEERSKDEEIRFQTIQNRAHLRENLYLNQYCYQSKNLNDSSISCIEIMKNCSVSVNNKNCETEMRSKQNALCAQYIIAGDTIKMWTIIECDTSINTKIPKEIEMKKEIRMKTLQWPSNVAKNQKLKSFKTKNELKMEKIDNFIEDELKTSISPFRKTIYINNLLKMAKAHKTNDLMKAANFTAIQIKKCSFIEKMNTITCNEREVQIECLFDANYSNCFADINAVQTCEEHYMSNDKFLKNTKISCDKIKEEESVENNENKPIMITETVFNVISRPLLKNTNSNFNRDETQNIVEKSRNHSMKTAKFTTQKTTEVIKTDGKIMAKSDSKENLVQFEIPTDTNTDINALKAHKNKDSHVQLTSKEQDKSRKNDVKNAWKPYHMDCKFEKNAIGGFSCNEWATAGYCILHDATKFLWCRKTCLCDGPSLKKKDLSMRQSKKMITELKTNK